MNDGKKFEAACTRKVVCLATSASKGGCMCVFGFVCGARTARKMWCKKWEKQWKWVRKAVEKIWKLEHKYSKNGAKMGPKCVKIGAKMSPNGLLEASWGLRGDLWEPCGSPGVSRGSKTASRVTSWGPFGGSFLVVFRNFKVFGSCFFGVVFWYHFGDLIYMVLRSILGSFFDVFLKLFRRTRGNVECGLDSLFIVYKAHGHTEKIVKKL